jgi:hypothetical protein
MHLQVQGSLNKFCSGAYCLVFCSLVQYYTLYEDKAKRCAWPPGLAQSEDAGRVLQVPCAALATTPGARIHSCPRSGCFLPIPLLSPFVLLRRRHHHHHHCCRPARLSLPSSLTFSAFFRAPGSLAGADSALFYRCSS